MTTAGSNQRLCIVDLLLQVFAMGVRVVRHKDIHQFQVQPLDHLLKRGIGLEYMNVHINGMDRRERVESAFFISELFRSRRRSGRLSGGREGDRET